MSQAPAINTTNAATASAPRQADTLCVLIERQKAQIALVIGGRTPEERRTNSDRFARICMTAVRQTPKLQNCTTDSFMSAMMTCAQLNLEPNTPQGLAYLIPYDNHKRHTTEAQFQIGYKGLLQLAYRSGMVASITADVVYRAELEAGMFSYKKGIEPDIRHEVDLLRPGLRSGEIVAAYAACKLTTGQTLLRVIDQKDVERAQATSASAVAAKKYGSSNSPWITHPEAMWMKTALKRLASWMPQTEMFATALDEDSRADRAEPEEQDVTPAAAGIAAINAAFSHEAVRKPAQAVTQRAGENRTAGGPVAEPQQPQQQRPAQQQTSNTNMRQTASGEQVRQPQPQPQQQAQTGTMTCPRTNSDVTEAICTSKGCTYGCPNWAEEF